MESFGISRLDTVNTSFTGGGEGRRGPTPAAGGTGFSQPADTVHLSSAARAHLAGLQQPVSTGEAESPEIIYGPLKASG